MTSKKHREQFSRVWRFIALQKLTALLDLSEARAVDPSSDTFLDRSRLSPEDRLELERRETQLLEPYGLCEIHSRDEKILYLLSQGKTYEEVGKIFDVCRERVVFLVNRLKRIIARAKVPNLPWL